MQLTFQLVLALVSTTWSPSRFTLAPPGGDTCGKSTPSGGVARVWVAVAHALPNLAEREAILVYLRAIGPKRELSGISLTLWGPRRASSTFSDPEKLAPHDRRRLGLRFERVYQSCIQVRPRAGFGVGAAADRLIAAADTRKAWALRTTLEVGDEAKPHQPPGDSSGSLAPGMGVPMRADLAASRRCPG